MPPFAKVPATFESYRTYTKRNKLRYYKPLLFGEMLILQEVYARSKETLRRLSA